MDVVLLDNSSSGIFFKTAADIYKSYPIYKGTEKSIEQLLLSKHCAFNIHAEIKTFVIRDGNDLVGRFALIDDKRQPHHIQVAFFESREGLGDVFGLIKTEINKHFPHRRKVVVGLNGHLNYGAGILTDNFGEPPLFGLPYNPPYYPSYFKHLRAHKMHSYRFSMEVYTEWAATYATTRRLNGLHVRFMNKKNIKAESALYTLLNNKAFAHHPFWANRDIAEDQQLFYPFRHLLENENLIFAEVNEQPVGFFLWYPDFNQLVNSQRDLNLWDVIRYRLGKRIDTFRFTEIGIIPEYQRSPVALALISKSLPVLIEKGYRFCEGGFIFEQNTASILFVKRILQRCYGKPPLPYRTFAVYETEI